MTLLKTEKQIFTAIAEHCAFKNGYYYLACPYTDEEYQIRHYRYVKSLSAMNFLLNKKILVFSPLAHTHPTAQMYDLPKDSGFWKLYDDVFVTNSIGMIIMILPGWAESKGIKHEFQLVVKEKDRNDYPIYILDEAEKLENWHIKPIINKYRETLQ